MKILSLKKIEPEQELNFPIFICSFCGTAFRPESMSELSLASEIAQELSYVINTRVSQKKNFGYKAMLFKSFCPSCGHIVYSNGEFENEDVFHEHEG